MPVIQLSPEHAWSEHLCEAAKVPGWVEDGNDVSGDLKVSKRELLGLILLANLRNFENDGDQWCVGYDPCAGEPNDGFISDGSTKVRVEHKLVPQKVVPHMPDFSSLEGILTTYEKFANKGPGYGANRVLLIHSNRPSEGLAKISSLGDRIGANGDCPFDQVLLAVCLSEGTKPIFQITEHYPGQEQARVELDAETGIAKVLYCKIRF